MTAPKKSRLDPALENICGIVEKLLYDLMVIAKEIIMEVWKDVSGWEGVYQVSSHGRMKSMARYVNSRNGGKRPLPEKIITPILTGWGYENVIASERQKRSTLVVHQVVAEHFIGKRPDGLVIDHIDGNKRNNRVENLRYCTHKDNLRKRHDRKLTVQLAEEIRAIKGKSQLEIAKLFGVSQAMIWKVISGRAWT